MKLTFLIGSLFLAFTPTFASDSLRTETVKGKQVMVYRVEKGQTMYAIARKFAINVKEIKALNPRLSQLKTGVEIYLPTKAPAIVEKAPASRGTDEVSNHVTHTVQRGETLYKISKQYNVPVAEIKKLNELNGGLRVGQDLIIPQKGRVASTAPIQKQSHSPHQTAAFNVTPKSEKKINSTGYPSITETGTAKLDESINMEAVYSVRHRTAAVGTLVLVKNKENGNSIHAKVIGNTANESVLLVVNKKVFEKLEPKSNQFLAEIFYTPEQ